MIHRLPTLFSRRFFSTKSSSNIQMNLQFNLDKNGNVIGLKTPPQFLNKNLKEINDTFPNNVSYCITKESVKYNYMQELKKKYPIFLL